MNADANRAFAAQAKANWRLEMPVLFLHAANDHVCETIDSRLAEPMREHVANLSETGVLSFSSIPEASSSAWLLGGAVALLVFVRAKSRKPVV